MIRPGTRLAVSLLLAWAMLTLVGCATQPKLIVVGTVEDTLVSVAVPTLPTITVNPKAGSTSSSSASSAARSTSPVIALTGLGSFVKVKRVMVSEGSPVQAGDVLALMDDAQLRVQVEVATSDAAVAGAQPNVLQAKIDETYDKADELADKRQEVEDGIATLKSNRSKLRTTRSDLLAARPQLLTARSGLLAQRSLVLTQAEPVLQQRATLAEQRAALLAQRKTLAEQLSDLQELLADLSQTPSPSPSPKPGCHETPAPTTPPTPPPSKDEILATIAQLEAAIAQIDAGLVPLDAAIAQIDAGLAPLNAGLAQMDAGLVTIDTGLKQIATGLTAIKTGLGKIADALTKARDGLTKLDEAEEKLLDGRQKLRNLKHLAEIAAEASLVPIRIARQQESLAIVTSPVNGFVVDVAAAGDLLAPGAILVTIREQAPAKVTAWLAPSELAQVCLNDRARVHGDWMDAGTSLPAKITRIGERWDYPPSSQATDQVHLTRAVPVEFTTTTGELPPGVPVELTISGCHKVATPS